MRLAGQWNTLEYISIVLLDGKDEHRKIITFDKFNDLFNDIPMNVDNTK